MIRKTIQIAALLALTTGMAHADHPVIEDATARQSGTGWIVSVTLSHPDTGWEHYADGWEVLTPEGHSLGLRTLVHPHVTEQPFTRSLSGVRIPGGVTELHIRARCLVYGWGDAVFRLKLETDTSGN